MGLLATVSVTKSSRGFFRLSLFVTNLSSNKLDHAIVLKIVVVVGSSVLCVCMCNMCPHNMHV